MSTSDKARGAGPTPQGLANGLMRWHQGARKGAVPVGAPQEWQQAARLEPQGSALKANPHPLFQRLPLGKRTAGLSHAPREGAEGLQTRGRDQRRKSSPTPAAYLSSVEGRS